MCVFNYSLFINQSHFISNMSIGSVIHDSSLHSSSFKLQYKSDLSFGIHF